MLSRRITKEWIYIYSHAMNLNLLFAVCSCTDVCVCICVCVCMWVNVRVRMTHGPRSPDWTKTDLPSPVNTLTQPKMEDPSRFPPSTLTEHERAPKGPKKTNKKQPGDHVFHGTASSFTVNLGWTNKRHLVCGTNEMMRWFFFLLNNNSDWTWLANRCFEETSCTICIMAGAAAPSGGRHVLQKQNKETQVHKKQKKRHLPVFFFLCVFVTLVRDLRKQKGLGWIFCSEWICRAALGFCLFLIDHHRNKHSCWRSAFSDHWFYYPTPNIAQTKKVNSVYF